MNFNDYQKQAMRTARYLEDKGLEYTTMGLCGEAGEVANKVKKIFRDHHGFVSEDMRALIKEELGDALWYIDMIAYELGLDFEEIAEWNVKKKLKERYKDMEAKPYDSVQKR